MDIHRTFKPIAPFIEAIAGKLAAWDVWAVGIVQQGYARFQVHARTSLGIVFFAGGTAAAFLFFNVFYFGQLLAAVAFAGFCLWAARPIYVRETQGLFDEQDAAAAAWEQAPLRRYLVLACLAFVVFAVFSERISAILAALLVTVLVYLPTIRLERPKRPRQ